MKKLWQALVIALGVVSLIGLITVASVFWPVFGDAQEARRTASIVVASLKDNWNEEKFAFHASPKLLALNQTWRQDLEKIRGDLGKIESAGDPQMGRVIREESVPKGVIYEVTVDVRCEKGPATIRMSLARFDIGFQLTQFVVENPKAVPSQP